MDAAIDEFADKMKEMAAQPQPQKPDPNAMKAEAEAKAAQQDADLKKQAAEQDMANKRELHAMNMQEKQAELEGKRIDARASQHADAVKYAADAAQRRDQRSLERIKLGLPDIEPPAPAPNTADSELLVELQRQNAAMMAQIGQFMQVVTQA
ncbi:MAG: hypothetical protein E5W99_17630, partial [Mesorhizobium sp.]